MRSSAHALCLGLFAPLFFGASEAYAQDNAATVEALFTAGKTLMAQGHMAEACPKFLASYNLEHRVGTGLNLADCYERNGQLASAWARFVEVTTLAQRANQPERAAFASDHAKALAAKLSTLTVTVPKAASGITVARDGVVLDAGAFGVAVPIDGGKHQVTASATGMKTWTGDVSVEASGDQKTVTVPPLELEATAAPIAEGATAAPGSKTRRIAGLATAGVGVIGVGVGAAFGVIAIKKKNDSGPDCGLLGSPNNCNSTGVGLRSTATSDGTLSTVFIGVGAAAVVGGAVLWFTGRASGGAKTTVGFDGRSVQVAGTF